VSAAQRIASGLLGAGLAAACVLRPVAHGVAASTVAASWAAILGLVVAPGVLLCAGGRLAPSTDVRLLVGMGATVGLAVHGLAFLLGRKLGLPGLAPAAALAAAAVGLFLLARGRLTAPPRAVAAAARGTALTLAAALAACVVQPLTSVAALGEPVPADLLFHAGNASELRHRWPLEDPRAAGLPLNYHLLAYALPVASAEHAGAPVADTLLGIAPLFWVGLLALQLSNAGRALVGDGRAGALGAAIAVLHADPGRLLGIGAGAFQSHFASGVYGSPTTVVGLVLLAGMAIALASWLEVGSRRALAALLLLAAAASGAKASVLPAVGGGLVLTGLLALAAGRRADAGRLLAACAGVALAGLPLTWGLATGESSYRTILRLGPGTLFAQSPFVAAAREWVGLAPGAPLGAWSPPLFALWLTGYLGLAGAGLVAWLLLRREPPTAAARWALATAVVGGLLALVVDAQGLSQLFFAYNGQLLLAPFAAAGLLLAARSPVRGALAALGLIFALPSADHARRVLPAALAGDVAATRRAGAKDAREYAAGLAWLRANASRDAVVFADNPSFLLSGFGEVRLYYENGLYTPRGWDRLWAGESEPFPERAALQEQLLRRPDAAVVAEARRALGPGPRLLVVADRVPSRIASGFVFAEPAPVPPRRFFPDDLFALRFANGAMQVYQAVEEHRVRPR
jgi:hypothetical protein